MMTTMTMMLLMMMTKTIMQDNCSGNFSPAESFADRSATETVSWAAESWTTPGATAPTADIAALVGATVSRGDWQAGNAMVYIFSHTSGQGIRWARSDNPSLLVTYTAEDWDACAATTCGEMGRCIGGLCECTGGFSGATCEAAPDLCEGIVCASGMCSGGHCNCLTGYGGDTCGIELTPNPCEGSGCGKLCPLSSCCTSLPYGKKLIGVSAGQEVSGEEVSLSADEQCWHVL